MSDDAASRDGNVDFIEDHLVAYLDGELDPDICREIERRLSEDSELRRRLMQHQRAWDLLEVMPRAEVNDSFAHTTVEMVAVSAADEVQQIQHQANRRRRILWTFAMACTIVAALAGYAVTSSILSVPDRQLVEDFPILENLDAYRYAESIEFLHALEHEGLFTGEGDDAL